MSDIVHPVDFHSNSKDPNYKHGPYGGKSSDMLSNGSASNVFPQKKTVKPIEKNRG